MTDPTHGAMKGRWKSTKNEKFDTYLEKHGLGIVKRKTVNKLPCTVEIIENEDGSWTVNEITAVRTATSKYFIGERHDSVHPVTLNEVSAIVVIEDGKIIAKGFADKESEDVAEWASRELLEDGTMLQVIYFGDIVCRRWFVKEA